MSPNGDVITVDNYIGGKFVPPSTGQYMDVGNPADSSTIGKVGLSATSDVNDAVAAAEKAFPAWSQMTMKARAAIVSIFIFFSTSTNAAKFSKSGKICPSFQR